jgi:hypothetical protein
VIALLTFLIFLVGLTAGAWLGLDIGLRRTQDALQLARYRDAIALCDDLLKTPDALDLRPRASKILDADRAARSNRQEN